MLEVVGHKYKPENKDLYYLKPKKPNIVTKDQFLCGISSTKPPGNIAVRFDRKKDKCNSFCFDVPGILQ